MGFGERLTTAVRRKGNPVLLGIDPRAESLPPGFLDRFPSGMAGTAEAFRAFARELLDVLSPIVPAVKFQAAFYEKLGPDGLCALQDSVARSREVGLIAIVDGKRNDIGSTAEAYADAYLGPDAPWEADALTVNGYLGRDGIAPFVEVAAKRDRGLYVLVRTSNPSAGEIQDLIADGRPIYRHMAELVARWAAPHRDASGYSAVGAVVGATYPAQLAELRQCLPGVPFLVPGYGSQGGTAADTASAFDETGQGALINNSRNLAFAYLRPDLKSRFGTDWQSAVAEAAREMIEALADQTPAGRLRERSNSL